MKEIVLNLEGKIYSEEAHNTSAPYYFCHILKHKNFYGKCSEWPLDKEREYCSSKNTLPLRASGNNQTPWQQPNGKETSLSSTLLHSTSEIAFYLPKHLGRIFNFLLTWKSSPRQTWLLLFQQWSTVWGLTSTLRRKIPRAISSNQVS